MEGWVILFHLFQDKNNQNWLFWFHFCEHLYSVLQGKERWKLEAVLNQNQGYYNVTL